MRPSVKAREYSRGRVALGKDQVAAVGLARSVPEVVESDVIEGGARREARDMAAQLTGDLVGADHHGHGVPADDRAQPPLDAGVARIALLLEGQDGVDVGRVRVERQHAQFARFRGQPIE